MAECAVRPVVVVMVLVLAKHGCGVPQVNDEDPVEEFASDAADEAFGDRVGLICPEFFGPSDVVFSTPRSAGCSTR